MAHFIWQTRSWPEFKLNAEKLLAPLGLARQAQGRILGLIEFFNLEIQADVLTEEAVTTSAIEGEQLNRDRVRSSVARRLGLPTAGLPETERQTDGLIEMLLDATRSFEQPMTADRLKSWQAALFPTGYTGLRKIVTGDWRRGPMEVVSGPIGREVVHYQAPPSDRVNPMMEEFLDWFQSSAVEMDGLVRAGIAHFWFLSIHPFDDGNGRIARALADMALAQDERTDCRMYSMSAQIGAERDRYYEFLEQTQRGSGDITEWIIWFLSCLNRAIRRSEGEVHKAMEKARMWQEIAGHNINERQKKVINKLFEAGEEFEGGLTTRKYVGMTSTSRETAKRDIADLVAKDLLTAGSARGRGASYFLSWQENKTE